MKSVFLSAQPIDETHGGGAVMLALLRKEYPEGLADIIEIHRRNPSRTATRYFRSPGLPVLGLMQLILPFMPFDFFSRFSFRLFKHLRALGGRTVVFHYSQLLVYPLLVRTLKSEIVVHDVLYDLWRSSSGWRRPLWRVIRFWESQLIRWLPKNATLVFLSEKDHALLSNAVRCQVRVLNLAEVLASDMVDQRAPERQTLALSPGVRVGLLGAWGRPENSIGAAAFLNALEPDVRDGLHFLIAGGGSEALPDGRTINKLGFVESLGDFFDGIDVFVAPLDSGAGVKIKVLNALEHGVPLYLTEKAVEGIPLPEGYPQVVAPDCRQLAEHFNKEYVRP